PAASRSRSWSPPVPARARPRADPHGDGTTTPAGGLQDPPAGFSCSSFPNSVWERAVCETPFRSGTAAKRRFARVRSQTELGTEDGARSPPATGKPPTVTPPRGVSLQWRPAAPLRPQVAGERPQPGELVAGVGVVFDDVEGEVVGAGERPDG